jgi:hypothetical protein
MSITVGKYTFEGPYISTKELEDKSGVYAIHCLRGGLYFLIDIGESATVKSRVDNHDRKDCWNRNCTGTLTVSVYYTPKLQQVGRMLIEQEIRKQYDPPCGKQ